jgi:hypothetical protein
MSELESKSNSELAEELLQLNERLWDIHAELNAVRIARAAIMNIIKDRNEPLGN